MHIAQLAPYYFPTKRWIGPASVVHELSRYFSKLGNEVSIITSFPSEQINSYEVLPYTKLYHFAILKGMKTYSFSPFLPLHFLKNQKYDIFHIHAYRNFFSDLGALFSKIKKIPLILTPHGTLERNVAARRGFNSAQKFFNFYDKLTSNFAVKTARRILFSSTQEKNLSNNFGIKNSVIPFGIDVNRFLKPLKPNNFRKKYHIQDNETILLSVGRISKEKNTILLLKTLKTLKELGYKNCKLVIVGESISSVSLSHDSYLLFLKKYSERFNLYDDLRFIGGLYGKDLVEAYLSSDIFISVSLAENFCFPILEAAASSLPIISSKVGIAQDFINDQETGILFGSYNPVELSNKIIYLIDNMNDAKKIGKKAFQKVNKEYSWESTCQAIERVYQEVMEESK